MTSPTRPNHPIHHNPDHPYGSAHVGYGPPPVDHPPTWSIPAQGSYPGPGLHPAGLGGFPAPPPRQGTSGLAVVALVVGILAALGLVVAVVAGGRDDAAGIIGLVLLGLVLAGLLLGVISLVQLRGSGRSGLPLAIVGLVLSAAVAIVLAVGVVVTATGSVPGPAAAPATPSPSATPTTAPTTPTAVRGVATSTADLEVGDCIQTLPDTATVSRVDVVTCTALHEGEVFYEYTVAGQSYPGDQQLQRRTSDTCNDRYRTLAPTAFADDAYNLAIYSPTRQSWATGSREVTCIATARTPVTGSVVGR